MRRKPLLHRSDSRYFLAPMATGPTLPPQAYTREILTAAFNWLQSQPESVRKLATTPDALVGLYMRAQRYGNSNLESDAPVSSQNFMSNLKSLAEGLKQFEHPAQSAQLSSQYTNSPHGQGHQVQMNQNQMNQNQAQQGQPLTPPLSQSVAAHLTSQMQAQIPLQTPSNLPNTATLRAQIHQAQALQNAPALNEMSLRMLQEVKSHLNLSSDSEAINMMLALAYKNLKALIG